MNSSDKTSQYKKLGVDPTKENVKEIFEKIIDNEYPTAFVNIITDPFNKSRVMTQHQDGDGSKFIQRLLHYYESGKEEVFDGMVDDALAMNSGDIASSGFVFEPWLITDVLNLNLESDLKEVVMKRIALRFLGLISLYKKYGFSIKFLGGETADLRDQVRSGVFDIAITAWARRKDLITGNVKPGDAIFGFSSDGQAVWEEEYNSGIMSNGLTLARSTLMKKSYNKKYLHLKREGAFYKGRFSYKQTKIYPGIDTISIGNLLLSPTRQWPIVIKELITILKKKKAQSHLHGIVMNTGGGATKIKNIGKNIHYFKTMPSIPIFFRIIQEESQENWLNMFESFNCGIGLDIVGKDSPAFRDALEETSEKTKVDLYRLGQCLKSKKEKNEVSLETGYGNFNY
ncbi:MAG: hypothetical protein WC928_03805 [Patescibacteria group bacterium]|jgi:phosphoribosylformylglycinamidine cyclo-ligase